MIRMTNHSKLRAESKVSLLKEVLGGSNYVVLLLPIQPKQPALKEGLMSVKSKVKRKTIYIRTGDTPKNKKFWGYGGSILLASSLGRGLGSIFSNEFIL